MRLLIFAMKLQIPGVEKRQECEWVWGGGFAKRRRGWGGVIGLLQRRRFLCIRCYISANEHMSYKLNTKQVRTDMAEPLHLSCYTCGVFACHLEGDVDASLIFLLYMQGGNGGQGKTLHNSNITHLHVWTRAFIRIRERVLNEDEAV